MTNKGIIFGRGKMIRIKDNKLHEISRQPIYLFCVLTNSATNLTLSDL